MTRSTPIAWRAVAIAFAAMSVCISFARFSLGLLLPDMRASLGLDYTTVGVLASLNLAGYLLGVLAIPHLSRWASHLQLVRAGLVLATLGMAALAAPIGARGLMAAVTVTGVAGGIGWVSAAVVGVEVSNDVNRGRILGVIGTANGVGIVVAAALAGLLSHSAGAQTWRAVWLVQAGLGLLACIVAARTPATHAPSPAAPLAARPSGLLLMAIGYGFFGAGYTWFAIYYVAGASAMAGMSGAAAWLVVGIGACSGALVFGSAGDRWGHARVLAATQGVAFCAAIVMAVRGEERWLVMAAGLLFGSVLTAMASLVPAVLAVSVGPAHAPAAFASLTLVLALVQIVSPSAGGLVVDHVPHGFVTLFGAAAATFAVAGFTFATHARRHPARS